LKTHLNPGTTRVNMR